MFVSLSISFIYKSMIKVSDIAKEKAVQLMKEDGYDPDTDYIRVGVKSGGSIGRTFFFSLIIFLISVAESSIIGAFIL